jgi:hypothetical protein
VILLDPPAWPAHGLLWSHLASDTSVDELHRFASRHAIPRRAFEADHYDVPGHRYHELIAAGAQPCSSRELLAALVAAGLRRPRRRSEELLASRHVSDYYPHAGPCRVDVIASDLSVPVATARDGWWLDVHGVLLRTVVGPAGWDLPPLRKSETGGSALGFVRVRLLEHPGRGYRGPWPWIVRPVRRPGPRRVGQWRGLSDARTRLADHDAWPLVEWLAAAAE